MSCVHSFDCCWTLRDWITNPPSRWNHMSSLKWQNIFRLAGLASFPRMAPNHRQRRRRPVSFAAQVIMHSIQVSSVARSCHTARPCGDRLKCLDVTGWRRPIRRMQSTGVPHVARIRASRCLRLRSVATATNTRRASGTSKRGLVTAVTLAEPATECGARREELALDPPTNPPKSLAINAVVAINPRPGDSSPLGDYSGVIAAFSGRR